MNTKLPLSVVVIARNEEENIGRCLASALPIAHELIVVINDTNDHTAEIARQFGAQVVESEWRGYRDQKNFAMSLASQPWILSLDADEALSPKLRTSIKSFIESPKNTRYNGAEFPRANRFMGKWIRHGDWYPDRQTRLFRKGCAEWTGKSVHENLHILGKKKCLRGDLEHYSYRNLDDQLKVLMKYTQLQSLDQRNKKISLPNVAFRSFWKFIRGYLFRLGFLDGFAGFYIAIYGAFATTYKYARIREDQVNNS